MKVTRTNNTGLGRLFDDFFIPDYRGLHRTTQRPAGIVSPRVNIMETDDAFLLDLAAPGWAKEDFEIELNEDVLTISANRRSEEKEQVNYKKQEFTIGSFKRAFRLPETTNGEEISANYENGLLRLSIPKKEEAKPRPPKSIAIG